MQNIMKTFEPFIDNLHVKKQDIQKLGLLLEHE